MKNMFQSVYSYSSSRWLMQLSKCCWSINTVDYTRYIPLSPLIISPLTNLFQGFPGHSMYCSAFQGGDPSCWSYPNKKATSISYKSHGNDPLIFLGKIHHVPPFSMGFSKGFGGGATLQDTLPGPAHGCMLQAVLRTFALLPLATTSRPSLLGETQNDPTEGKSCGESNGKQG